MKDGRMEIGVVVSHNRFYMAKRFSADELEFAVGMMRSFEKNHSGAKVRFDGESGDVLVLYSPPADMFKIDKIELLKE